MFARIKCQSRPPHTLSACLHPISKIQPSGHKPCCSCAWPSCCLRWIFPMDSQPEMLLFLSLGQSAGPDPLTNPALHILFDYRRTAPSKRGGWPLLCCGHSALDLLFPVEQPWFCCFPIASTTFWSHEQALTLRKVRDDLRSICQYWVVPKEQLLLRDSVCWGAALLTALECLGGQQTSCVPPHRCRETMTWAVSLKENNNQIKGCDYPMLPGTC